MMVRDDEWHGGSDDGSGGGGGGGTGGGGDGNDGDGDGDDDEPFLLPVLMQVVQLTTNAKG